MTAQYIAPGRPGGHVTSANEATQPVCLVCGDETVRRFTKPLERLEVHYFYCSCCGHLTATPLEVDQSYAAGRYFKEIDTGWEQRNKRMLEFIRIISCLPAIAISKRSAILDYGSGTGRLVLDLNQEGFDAYGFEPYLKNPCSDRVFTDLRVIRKTVGRVELITCIEVLEHLDKPDEMLSDVVRLLQPAGYLLISTDLYNEKVHSKDWYYLNPAAGHVSIFSETSLRMLLRRHGFYPVLRINGAVWLLRKAGTVPGGLLERIYLAVSQARLKLGLRVNYRQYITASSG